MASAETFFNAETDKLFHLSANGATGEAELKDMDFIKYGHVNSWLFLVMAYLPPTMLLSNIPLIYLSLMKMMNMYKEDATAATIA